MRKPLLWLLHNALQLAPIIGGVELALRGGDESIGSNLPTLEAADANPMSAPSRPGVGADQRPVVLSTIRPNTHVVHNYLQIRERGHE